MRVIADSKSKLLTYHLTMSVLHSAYWRYVRCEAKSDDPKFLIRVGGGVEIAQDTKAAAIVQVVSDFLQLGSDLGKGEGGLPDITLFKATLCEDVSPKLLNSLC
jgi:hypothetical protein